MLKFVNIDIANESMKMQTRMQKLAVAYYRSRLDSYIKSEIAEKPNFLTEKDENGKTFWHHFIEIQILNIEKEDSYSKIVFLLFKDWLCKLPNSGLNILSSSGESAFCAAINANNIDAAKFLLDLGADPTLCGDDEYDPLYCIDLFILKLEEDIAHTRQKIELVSKANTNDLFAKMHNLFKNNEKEIIRQLSVEKAILLKSIIEAELLKKRIKSIAITKNAEIDKNAGLLAQAFRTDSMPFSSLPRELLIEIAMLTRLDQTVKQARTVATNAFFRPISSLPMSGQSEQEPTESSGCTIM